MGSNKQQNNKNEPGHMGIQDDNSGDLRSK